MTYISVTNALNNNAATSDITLVGANFTDIVNGLSDGTKAINVASIALASGTAFSTLAGGTHTPSLTNTDNITSSSLVSASYMRIGNIVTAALSVSITPTAASAATTRLTFTLPVSCSTTPVGGGCSNAYAGSAAVTQAGAIYPVSASTMGLEFSANSTTPMAWYGVYQYIVN